MTTAMTGYTVTIPPLGTLVRQGAIRLWTRRDDAPIGGLEQRGPWHYAGDRAGRNFHGWNVRTICGHQLMMQPSEDDRFAVRYVLATADFPSGTVCLRCADGLRRLRRELAPVSG